MFYIKLDDSMSLVITAKEPIYRGDNLKQKIIYLIPKMVGEVDMLTAYIYLNYIRADGTPDVVILERGEEEYNNSYYQYTFPINCTLTRYPGEVCTWLQIYSGTPSNPTVAKSGECVLQIMDSRNMDDLICDRQITALYQLHRQMTTGFEQVEESINAVEAVVAAKADNIVFNSDDNTIQLVANGNPIGDRIVVTTNTGLGIIDMRITADGELLVFFDDDSIKNLGTVVGSDGKIYVPHIDEHKILTFTLEDEPGKIPPATDLNPNDEWSGIGGATIETDYVWEPMESN